MQLYTTQLVLPNQTKPNPAHTNALSKPVAPSPSPSASFSLEFTCLFFLSKTKVPIANMILAIVSMSEIYQVTDYSYQLALFPLSEKAKNIYT